MILLFGGNKCSGKSTTSANAAIPLAEKMKTLIVNTDPQQSINKWHERRIKSGLSIKYKLVDCFSNIAENLMAYDTEYDLVIVDVAGVNSEPFLQSLAVADLTVITLEPTIKTLETLDELITQRKKLIKSNPNNLYAFLQVRTKNDFSFNKKRQRFLNCVNKLNFGKPLNTVIFEKDSFPDSDDFGGTVFETKDKNAQGNINCFVEEIIKYYNN